ncbi:MAG: DNA-3-methyladenine glycosylase 2 family protein [Betaproteobacteria bacterium]|nr:DNA-3-methyladenine glycosylase 2 family protein [Betaproteobacteria bacterium]
MTRNPTSILLDDDAAYLALQTRDARFDGRFFVGVTSTRIYCRPVCKVRPPMRKNCRFFANAALAEQQGFRPCLRCRPEQAPGLSMMDSSQALACRAATMLGQAAHEGLDPTLPALAQRLGVTDRHLRRIFNQVHGVSPLAYLSTQRLLLAKQLLTDTAIPVTEVALATGYASLRRFNASFVERYRMSPSALRKASPAADGPDATREPMLRMAWRPPYDVDAVLGFFARRAVPGVETVEGLTLRRTLAVEHRGEQLAGWLTLRFRPDRHELALSVSPSMLPALGLLLNRVRQAFDLDADPALIDPVLADIGSGSKAGQPGMRLLGGLDGFEIAARVILGQQVTVAAARTLTLRLVERFGEAIATPYADLGRLFPSSRTIADASAESIGTLGIVRQRVAALQALAAEVAAGRIELQRSAPLQATLDALRALPGIGDWSAQLIAMRALAWPDAWPATDIGVLNALREQTGGERNAKLAEAHAERWRPWRAYAVMKLWQQLEP